MTQDKYDIFISYSRKDIEIADKICTALEGAGISCFIDREGISTGEDFVNKITHNIENSQFFLFLASKNAYEAKFTPKEVLYAIEYKPKESIIPYIIDNSPIDKKYKFLITDIHYQTMEQCPIEPSLIDDILKRLGRKRKVNEITKDYLLSLPDDEFEIFEFKGKSGYTLRSSEKLEIIIPCNYDEVYPFRDGVAKVVNEGRFGLIDKYGNELVSCRYDQIKEFKNDLAKVQIGDKYGFIDKTGKEIIPLKYDDAGLFSEGLAGVTLNGKRGFVNKTGKEVIPLIYDYAESFSEGLASVRLDYKWGVINMNGDIITDIKYEYVGLFNEKRACVVLNRKYGFIDNLGVEVIPCIFDDVTNFSEGLACVEKNGIWGYINIDGEYSISGRYLYPSIFQNGIAKVTHVASGKTYYMDKNGDIVKE